MKNPSQANPQATWEEYYGTALSLAAFHNTVSGQFHFIQTALGHDLRNRRILEVGCANAYLGMYLASIGARYVGVDLSFDLLSQSRDWSSKSVRLDLMQGDLLSLPFQKGTFDLIYSQGLLEHFDPPVITAALRESLRVSRLVAFSVPTCYWRGGLRGDERLLSVKKWLDLVGGLGVVDVTGQAHYNLLGRILGFVERRFAYKRNRTLWVIRQTLVRLSPGELYIVLASEGS
ncbi:MAG: class I SAM-dependent methyltransferase [Chloroflexi bacterium]|nr:class I SAM-dependent methyltransferase [Chloroflexota bacterium]